MLPLNELQCFAFAAQMSDKANVSSDDNRDTGSGIETYRGVKKWCVCLCVCFCVFVCACVCVCVHAHSQLNGCT